MTRRSLEIRRALIPVLLFMGAAGVWGGSVVECDFNGLSEGRLGSRSGWKVYDKVKGSSAFMVASEVGVTEMEGDNALVVKRTDEVFRCVTGDAVRWLRGQTARVEFDFRLVAADGLQAENEPVMIFLMGNSILSEHTRWEMKVSLSTNGAWVVSASMPDETSATIPADQIASVSGGTTRVSEWLHCVIEVKKQPEADTFNSSLRILNASGAALVDFHCTDTDRGKTTRAMWNLSRLHAGFLASREIRGLSCIDNVVLKTEP